MSKPESNASKVLISNSTIGLAVVAFVVGSLFFIYVIHVHIVRLQNMKSTTIKTAKSYTDSRHAFKAWHQKFNHGLYTLSNTSEEFLQTSLEHQALLQYTQCKSQTYALWEAISPVVNSKFASLETMTWDSTELSFELHTEQEQRLFDLLSRLKSDKPDLILHLDQVSHMGNEDHKYSIVNGRLSHELCAGGQS